jgi:hypothetical protein
LPLFLLVTTVNEDPMSKHGRMPPVPTANHSQKGPGDHSEIPSSEPPKHPDVNPQEQGQTANIRQNTTNKGFVQARRSK